MAKDMVGRVVPACGISGVLIDSSVHNHDGRVHQAHPAQAGKIVSLYTIMLTAVKKKAHASHPFRRIPTGRIFLL
jgi:hypothetical protein